MNTQPPHILVFDSGVGGLSIVQAIQQHTPTFPITYLADNLHFPYGLLDEDFLVDRVEQLLLQVVQASPHVDMIVVACNTASTLVLPRLRARLSIPIVGVVPAIKPAAALSANRTIGLLATPGTVKRSYTDDLINEFAPHCDVIKVGSSELVTLAEAKISGAPLPPDAIEAIVAPFKAYPLLDTVVLACTHFPLLAEELAAALPNVTHWVDSGEAIARRVAFLADEFKTIAQAETKTKLNGIQQRAYFTNVDALNPALETFLLGLDLAVDQIA